MSELDRLFEVVSDGFKRTDVRLDAIDSRIREQNSKVANHERDIAVLKATGERPPDTRTRATDVPTLKAMGQLIVFVTAVGGIVETAHQVLRYLSAYVRGH